MRALVISVLLFVSTISLTLAQGHMGTPEEQRACSRDAQRFCRQQLSDDFAVQQCLQQNRNRLTRPCQRVFQSHGM
jgi:type II secretory pathway component PulL